MMPVSSPMMAFPILNVEHGGSRVPATSGWCVVVYPDEHSITTRAPARSPKVSFAADAESREEPQEVSNVSAGIPHRSMVERGFISFLPNVAANRRAKGGEAD